MGSFSNFTDSTPSERSIQGQSRALPLALLESLAGAERALAQPPVIASISRGDRGVPSPRCGCAYARISVERRSLSTSLNSCR